MASLIGLSLGDRVWSQPVWNIAEHGAVEGRDVTAVINEGLETQHEHGLPVFIPHGRWGITSTIELPARDGGALVGVGAAGGSANKSLRGLGSVLEWYGPGDQPMLRMQGSRWCVENLSLRGIPFRTEAAKAGMGILITRAGRGLGTGKHEFRNVSIEGCKVGIQCGVTPGEHNNDNLGFERLIIGNCDVAYRSINSQAMSHWIDRLEVRKTPIAFQFYGGGMLHLRNVFAVDTILLDIQQNDPPEMSPGQNNAVFKIENLKVDAQHRGKFCLVRTHETSQVQVILECGMISGPSRFTLADVGPGTQLVIRDLTSPTSGAAIEKHVETEVLLDNVRITGIE